MSKLGTREKPIIVRVQTQERAHYVAQVCEANGWRYIVGLEPHNTEDITDLDKALNPPPRVAVPKMGRNEPCPCGSGQKYKKCCGSDAAIAP